MWVYTFPECSSVLSTSAPPGAGQAAFSIPAKEKSRFPGAQVKYLGVILASLFLSHSTALNAEALVDQTPHHCSQSGARLHCLLPGVLQLAPTCHPSLQIFSLFSPPCSQPESPSKMVMRSHHSIHSSNGLHFIQRENSIFPRPHLLRNLARPATSPGWLGSSHAGRLAVLPTHPSRPEHSGRFKSLLSWHLTDGVSCLPHTHHLDSWDSPFPFCSGLFSSKALISSIWHYLSHPIRRASYKVRGFDLFPRYEPSA